MSTESNDTTVDGKSPRNPKIQLAKEPFPPLQMPLGYEEICSILPHRYPFLLVDRIIELEPGHRCVGVKCVTANEEYFKGHFPGHPVMPGVLMLEAMAQVAGVLTLVSRNTPGALSYFAKIEEARFKRPVRPGDQLVAEATLQVLRGAYCKVQVSGSVDNQVVVEAEYTFISADSASSAAVMQNSTAVGTVPGKSHSAAPFNGQGTVVTPEAAKEVVEKANSSSPNGSTQNGASPAVRPTIGGGRTQIIEPPREGVTETFIHPTAIVDVSVELEEGVWIGPHCIVEGGTQIGSGTVLEANVLIKRGTSIGRRCRIWPNAVLGHEPQDMKFHGEESYLRIGDDNILREMVTIHRATGEGEATTIGNGNLLMAYVHIGHNCTIGNNNLISNSCGISGHVTIEDRTVIGGFVGIHQNVHIGNMAMVGGVSKVVQDVPPFSTADGRPAKIHGLNIRGLRRNGVPSEQRIQVGNALKLLYRSDLNTSQALERIRAEIPRSETLDYLTDFIERVREGRLGRQHETPHL